MTLESPEEELLDIVDEDDQVVGQARRGEAYARRLRHRSTFVLVKDSNDGIFVHRRTASKLIFPSHYDMFVGGVVQAGESYDDAALREAEEVAWHTFLTAAELEERLGDWLWMPDSIQAYQRLKALPGR